MSKLTPQQERFALEVASGKSQADAYRAAYPKALNWKESSVHSKASVMMSNVKVSARVKELQELAADKAMMTAAEVLKEAWRLARFDIRKLYRPDGSPIPIHELDEDTAAAIQAVDIHEEYEGGGKDRVFVGYTKKYKTADKNSALDKLFKHFGLYEQDNKQKVDPIASLIESLSGNVLGVKKTT